MGVVTRAQAKRKRLHSVRHVDDTKSLDLFSLLPDEVLGNIISFLPTKDGARTQILSSRWRPLWRSAPLNLDVSGTDITGTIVSHILSVHQGPARRLHLSPSIRADNHEESNAWLLSPALNNLQELRFGQVGRLPPSAFCFSSTLCIAEFTLCEFSDDAVLHQVHFPKLQQLTLECVSISEDALHAMLAGCPSLDSLILKFNSGFRRLRISLPNLRCVDLYFEIPALEIRLEEVIVEDAPCLKRLIQRCGPYHEVHISVISAPKLELLAPLTNDNSRIQLGNTVFQRCHAVRVASVFRSVKVLSLRACTLTQDAIINFMKCFPCLEHLFIEAFRFSKKNVWHRKPLESIECLDLHLKILLICPYQGDDESHVNLATFFAQNAKVLELMHLGVPPNKKKNNKWIGNQRKRLMWHNRASSAARFHFTSDVCCHFFTYTDKL